MRPRFLGSLCAAASLIAVAAPAIAAEAPKPALKAAQMVDLAPNHWAYGAIQSLVEKYRIMSGFPDKSFRGQKPVSRYELAAALATIMDRFASLDNQNNPATPQDQHMVDRLKDEFKVELTDLNNRLVAIENNDKTVTAAIADLKAKSTAGDKVHGNIGVTYEDDPTDNIKPYVVTNFEVRFGSNIDPNTSYSASIVGGNKGNDSGGQPVFARGDAKDKGLPNGNMQLNSNAVIQTLVPSVGNATFKVGQFGGGGIVSLGGFAHHYGDGIIGSGLFGPGGNAVHLGGDVGIGGKLKTGGLGFGGGVNTKYAYGGLGVDLAKMGDVNFMADVVHNDFDFTGQSGDFNSDYGASLNLGSDKLGLSIQGGMALAGNKVTPKAGINFVTNIAGNEICLGGAYKTDPDGTTIEVIPTGYVFRPAQGWIPSLLIGAKEPETIQGKGVSGFTSGSLLGTKAGMTVQVGVPNPLMPNLTLEWDLQQPVINFQGGTYDGMAIAITTSTDF